MEKKILLIFLLHEHTIVIRSAHAVCVCVCMCDARSGALMECAKKTERKTNKQTNERKKY